MLWLTACVSVAPLEKPDPRPDPLPAELANRFSYDAPSVRGELSLRKEKARYRIYDGTIDAGTDDDDDTPITFEFYEQPEEEPAPVVLVLPILNGQKEIVRPFARHFAKHGYSAVIVDTLQRKTLIEDLLEPETAIRRTTVRHRRVLDWIETMPNLDAGRIAVFGASLGGFNALFLAAADQRVCASALALVGGDLPFVLTHSTENRIAEAVDAAMLELGTDRDGLREFLGQAIQSDPISLAPYLDSSRVLMVLAKFDDAVPYEKQLELRGAMGGPEAITLPTGHITSALYLLYLRKYVRKFFDRTLPHEASGTVAAAPEPAACAAVPTGTESATGQATDVASVEQAKAKPLLDRTQQTVYDVVNASARWVDGFFATGEIVSNENVTRGLVSLGTYWDERDGAKARFRLRARFPLTALKERTRLIFGRGDVDQYVDGSDEENADNLPSRFNDFEDDDWLLGVGYSRGDKLARGWDFDAGVRISTPLDPYVRATYRWNKPLGDEMLLRVSPRIFWQKERGEGVSLTGMFDYVASHSWLVRWWTNLTAEEQVEGMGWTTRITAYQTFTDGDAISYGIYGTGETSNDVPLQDYGVEFHYRKRILREWFLVDLSTRLSWPREFLDEQREPVFGFGVEFEMQFGEWPARNGQE